MSRVSRAAPHLSLEAVEQKLKSTESYWHRQKWLIVYNGLVDPRPASAIAKQTGVSVGTVHKVSSQYNQLGVAALETPGKGGRYNSYLTREQEKEFGVADSRYESPFLGSYKTHYTSFIALPES
jgi:hypothetical protein